MRATVIGSFPGESQRDQAEALALVWGELAADERGIPVLPEVPGRGAAAGMVGRTVGLLDGVLDADLQPSGWRLTGTSGATPRDQRRARSLLAQDLDGLEERAQGHAGALKVQVVGPLTLAASVERPRGDRLLADHGARRELAEALAEAVGQHVADVRRRVGGVTELIVQVDEPALPAVLAGAVPTASGFGRHRVVHPPEASAALEVVSAAIASAGAVPWAHCCAPAVPWGLVRGAGMAGLALDLDLLAAADLDAAGEALEAGTVLGLGVVPTTGTTAPASRDVVERVLRWLDVIGLDPDEVGERIVLTPACGLAGRTWPEARRSVEVLRSAVGSLS